MVQYPAKLVLAMHFLGGEEFDLWYSDLLRQISRYGKDMGCDGIESVARFGFRSGSSRMALRRHLLFTKKGMKNGVAKAAVVDPRVR